MRYFVDIEVYTEKNDLVQGKYLAHGIDDVLWTDSLEEALNFLKYQVMEGNSKYDK